MANANATELKKYQQALGTAIEALSFYADPSCYHAIAFMSDRPAGSFADDFDKKHGNDFYDRPMPGKYARAALRKLTRQYGNLTIIEPRK